MSNEPEKNVNDSKQEITVYGAVAIAIFLIVAGVAYAFPGIFPRGTLYVVFGVLVALVGIIHTFRGIKYDVFSIALVATGFILIGVDKIFTLGIKFWPSVLIIVGVAGFLVNINKLRSRKK